MTPIELVYRAHEIGFRLELTGDGFQAVALSPDAVMGPTLRADLAANKVAVVNYLKQLQSERRS